MSPSVRAVRGATTVDQDTPESITERVVTLLRQILERNELVEDDLISILFTATEDIVNCATRIRSGGGRRQLRNAVVRVRNVLGGLPALVPAGGLLMSGSR